MSELPQINSQLMQEDIFELFKNQMKKDFEGAGLDGQFASQLPAQFEEIKRILLVQLEPLLLSSSHTISSLLYRVDISEKQLQGYQSEHQNLVFPEILAELVIKRVLQKVILKKNFSK